MRRRFQIQITILVMLVTLNLTLTPSTVSARDFQRDDVLQHSKFPTDPSFFATLISITLTPFISTFGLTGTVVWNLRPSEFKKHEEVTHKWLNAHIDDHKHALYQALSIGHGDVLVDMMTVLHIKREDQRAYAKKLRKHRHEMFRIMRRAPGLERGALMHAYLITLRDGEHRAVVQK